MRQRGSRCAPSPSDWAPPPPPVMQETPRRSTRALFASKAGDGGGAATPSSGLLFLDPAVHGMASPSTAFGFPTSAQQSRFRRGALFGSASDGAAAGPGAGCGDRATESGLGAAPLAAAFRGAARVKRHARVLAASHGCNPDGDRSAGPRCGVRRGTHSFPGVSSVPSAFPASPASCLPLTATAARRWTAVLSHRGASALGPPGVWVVGPQGDGSTSDNALRYRLYTLPHNRRANTGSPSSSPSTTSTRPSPNTRRVGTTGVSTSPWHASALTGPAPLPIPPCSPSRSGRTPFGSSVDMTPFARLLRLGSGANTPCSSPPGQALLAPVASTPSRRTPLHTGGAGRRHHSHGGSPPLGPQDGTLASAAAHAASAMLHDIHRPGDASATPVHGKRKRASGRDDTPPERPQRPKLSEVLMRRHRMAALESDQL